MYLCPDCGCQIEIPVDLEENEILSCTICGLELQAKVCRGLINLTPIELEGEDFGE